MSDNDQEKYIKYRFLQYSANFYLSPSTPINQQTPMGSSVDTQVYTEESNVIYPTGESTTIEKPIRKRREFSAVKAGLILLFALIISGALIIYALSRFIG